MFPKSEVMAILFWVFRCVPHVFGHPLHMYFYLHHNWCTILTYSPIQRRKGTQENVFTFIFLISVSTIWHHRKMFYYIVIYIFQNNRAAWCPSELESACQIFGPPLHMYIYLHYNWCNILSYSPIQRRKGTQENVFTLIFLISVSTICHHRKMFYYIVIFIFQNNRAAGCPSELESASQIMLMNTKEPFYNALLHSLANSLTGMF